jgi:precorrin-2 dehydrogenase / sirohydrochlorin ferrochelatase
LGDAEKSGMPILLEVSGRPAVVIGGGAQAAALTSTLLSHGAAVTVVAVSASIPMHALAAEERITLVSREYVRGDLAGACFAACFEGGEVAVAVSAEAAAERCPLTVPVQPELSSATVVDVIDPQPSVWE